MEILRIGDEVSYSPWTGGTRRATVEEIEICPIGSKEGRSVSSCNIKKHSNGVLSLSDGHWCYFNQVKTIHSNGR